MDNEYLGVWYSEAQNELRWRREVEYKLLGSNLTFYGLITAGIGLSEVSPSEESKLLIPALVTFSFLLIAGLSIYKIIHDNNAYKNIGQSVARWHIHTGFPKEILPEDIDNYGLGRGHLKTGAIILCAAVMSSLVIIVKYSI